tara:strand:- start:49 stop:246 length:198 start_codon:yes stop_codon:yes gene_type:complete
MKSFRDFSEEMMTTGPDGFTNKSKPEGPTAGYDPLMFAKPIKRRKDKNIKSDWITHLTRRSYKKI